MKVPVYLTSHELVNGVEKLHNNFDPDPVILTYDL